jgi:hypothetical protein
VTSRTPKFGFEMASKNKSFSSKNKLLVTTFLGSAWLSFVFYLAMRDQEKQIAKKTRPSYDSNDLKALGVTGMFLVPPSNVGLYTYEIIIPPNVGDGRILPGQDPLGKFNLLYPTKKLVTPAPMLGFSKKEEPYPSIHALAGVMDNAIESFVKTRMENQNLILSLFNIPQKNIEGEDMSAIEKYNQITSSILVPTLDTSVSGLISLAINCSASYWYMRFEALFPLQRGVEPDSCKRSDSKLDCQRIGAAVIWTLLQDAITRHSWDQNKPEVALKSAIEALKKDLVGDAPFFSPNNQHLWQIALFKEGCFNCETPGLNRMLSLDTSKSNPPKKLKIDIDSAKSSVTLIGGIIFHAESV